MVNELETSIPRRLDLQQGDIRSLWGRVGDNGNTVELTKVVKGYWYLSKSLDNRLFYCNTIQRDEGSWRYQKGQKRIQGLDDVHVLRPVIA